MATLWAQDLVEEARLSYTAMGFQAARKFLVIGAVRDVNQAPLKDAIGLAPKIGDAHPRYSDLFCERVDSNPAVGSSGNIYLLATYTPANENNTPPNGKCFVEASAITVNRDYVQDKDGNLMFINCTRAGVVLDPQPVKPTLQFPMTYLVFKRLETPNGQFATLQPFIGCVNVSTWGGPGETVNYLKRSVLCTAIKIVPEGSVLRMRYEFQCFGKNLVVGQNNTWDVQANYKDPVTKENINTGLSSTPPSTTNPPSFRVYPEIDLNALGLFPHVA